LISSISGLHSVQFIYKLAILLYGDGTFTRSIIKIKESRWVDARRNEMIYRDDAGRLFIGPPLNSANAKAIAVEIDDGVPKDGYLRILNVVGYLY
jgi:hypothetical protein